jgi:hypothetical protein
MRIYQLLVVALLVASPPALAWHERGHRTTASIAYEQMSAARQSAVLAILEAHPRWQEDFESQMPPEIASGSRRERGRWALGQASIWPDLVPRLGDAVRTEFHRGRWHYINLPVWLTEDDQAKLEGRLDHNMATTFRPPLRQNLNVIQALRGNLQVWHDDAASDAEKAVALCWILHLAGDMHQPLHTVALFSAAYFPTGDRGGNNIEVVWGNETRNLHAVWDGLPSDMDDLSPSSRTRRSIDSDEVDDQAIDEWLSHHANLADKFVYSPPVREQLLERLGNEESPVIEVSSAYLVAARSIVRRQVNLAGHRIARLLE